MPASKNHAKPHSRAHRRPVSQAQRAALVDLPATGCEYPVPDLPAGRDWSEVETARWAELWESPQATQWDDSARGTVAVLVSYESAIFAGLASAWQAQEARYAAEALGLTPKASGIARLADRRMSVRREARRNTSSQRTSDRVPEEIRAGACVEVWVITSDAERAIAEEWGAMASRVIAHSRFHAARNAWMKANGLHVWDRSSVPSLVSASPWSFDSMKRSGRSVLASALKRRGLPVSWRPSPVESYDYGPPTVETGMTWDQYRSVRDRAGTESAA